ncbi:hypothetical protein ASZ90_016921 [hydrocarbon metagenome]|uniref:Uncharacterized protein n=1 Tax=hydrocarbon metagenome TaxID=938273 RepID=A0A0W8EB11_9ZZZZ
MTLHRCNGPDRDRAGGLNARGYEEVRESLSGADLLLPCMAPATGKKVIITRRDDPMVPCTREPERDLPDAPSLYPYSFLCSRDQGCRGDTLPPEEGTFRIPEGPKRGVEDARPVHEGCQRTGGRCLPPGTGDLHQGRRNVGPEDPPDRLVVRDEGDSQFPQERMRRVEMYRGYCQVIVPGQRGFGIDPGSSPVDIYRIGEVASPSKVVGQFLAAMDGIKDENSHAGLQEREHLVCILHHEIGEERVTADWICIEEGYGTTVQGKLSPGLPLAKADDCRDIFHDMDPLGEEEGDDDQNVDLFVSERLHGIIDGGGIHVHEPAFHHEIRVPVGDEPCSLFYQFLVIRKFATMPHEEDARLTHTLRSCTAHVKSFPILFINQFLPEISTGNLLRGVHSCAACTSFSWFYHELGCNANALYSGTVIYTKKSG